MQTLDTTAAARFLVVGNLPLVVVDLEPADPTTPAMLADDLFRRLVERGLVVLPRFLGVDLPRGARVGFTAAPDELRLEDERETRLLRVPRASVDPAWLRRSLELRGTMAVVGRDLGIDPDQSPAEVAGVVEAACGEGRVAGAIVGVVEPRSTLPLLF